MGSSMNSEHLTRWGWCPGVSQRNVAYACLIALSDAEAVLMPNGSHSRLFAAVRTANATVRFLSNPTFIARVDLAAQLEDLKLIESNAVLAGNLPVGSLVQRGLSLSIHIAQAALAGCDVPAEYALGEARWVQQTAVDKASPA